MKQTIDDLRIEYKRVTGKDASIRWNKRTLEKKITDAEILKAGYAVKAKAVYSQDSDVKPEFERLIADEVTPSTSSVEDVAVVERRGGPREGAGRPTGQSDERARVQRLLELEVPDLCVKKFVQGLNLVLKRFTPVAFEADQVDKIALGITLPLYYWLPSIEGASNPFVLHLQALEYIGEPVMKRAETIMRLNVELDINEKQNMEGVQEHGKEYVGKKENAAPAAEPKPAVKKSLVKAHSAAKRRK